jgi:hypothetical protein
MMESQIMRGEMALDMVVKFLIILVVVAVVIGLFLKFSGDSKDAVKDMFKPNSTKETGFPKTLQQNSFGSGEVANYIESCYSTMSKIPAAQQKDITCYVLMSNSPFSSTVTSSGILDIVDAKIKSKVKISTDFSKDYIRINFVELTNTVVVS